MRSRRSISSARSRRSEAGRVRFQRGVTDYPGIGASAALMSDRELRLIYDAAGTDTRAYRPAAAGRLASAPTSTSDELLSKHFAILGTTGVGKSSGVAIILQQILRGAAEPAHLPDRSAQRIRPLLRRARPGADAAQPQAAVLAVQFRGDHRRHLRRPSGRRGGDRDPVRGHSGGEVRLSAISRRDRSPRSPRSATPRPPATPPTRRSPTASTT